MKNHKKISLSLILIFAMAFSLVAIPTVPADEIMTITPYPILSSNPNPVGVDQETLILLGLTWATAWPQHGWEDLTITVTRPDGTTETLGPVDTDTTGMTGMVLIPTMVGSYNLQLNVPEQTVQATAGGRTPPLGTILRASSIEYELIVQEDPIPHYPGVPLPTEYWTRPIDAQSREWSQISASWLYPSQPFSAYAPYNEGPESAHILWTNPLEVGGLIGGEFDGLSYSHGDAYEGRFNNRIILNGILYYNAHQSQGGSNVEQTVVAVDIHTGEELWRRPLIDPDGNNIRLSFGQIMHWDTMNHHGAWPYLWATVGSTWHAFSPTTGRWEYTMTGVPGGTNQYGPNGEIIRYTVNLAQNTIQRWNSTHAVYMQLWEDFAHQPNPAYQAGRWRPQGRTFDASLGIEWNVAIDEQPTGPGSRILPGSAKLIFVDDRIIGTNTNWAQFAPEPIAMWGVSIAPGQEGQLLFNTTWQRDVYTKTDLPGGIPAHIASLEDGVFVMADADQRLYYGFCLDTGDKLWETTEPEPALNAYTMVYTVAQRVRAVAYGKLYTSGMGGEVNAYDIITGEKVWSYQATDPYNEMVLGDWSTHIAFVTDGKVYIDHMEHSTIDPRPRNAPFLALDAETGEVVFRIDGLRIGTRWGGPPLIADSVIIGFNTYDNQIYALGKGPSATTVEVLPKVSQQGSGLIIEGKVTDVSPGAQDSRIAMRFPNGIPVVADESMGEWMKYVYMQFPSPTDVQGVEVTLTVRDPAGEYYVTTATTDSNGKFSHLWTPTRLGEYHVTVEFKGSNSYYRSHDMTTFAVVESAVLPAPVDPTPPPPVEPTPTPPVDEPTPTPPPTEVPPPDAPAPMNWYLIIAAVVVVAVVAATAVILKKRK